MLVSVYSPKGGVGKSSISFFLSHYFNAYYKTNDNINSYVLLETYTKVLKGDLTQEIIENENIIFDCGGFIDPRLEELIENSNYLLVPCDTGINSQITISQMKKPFEDLIDKEKIFYIINNYKDRKSLEQTKENLISLGINENNILGLKSSKIFENGYEKNKCLFEIANETGLTKSQYKTVIEDWEKIVKTIK